MGHHQSQAIPLHKLIIIIIGVLGILCVIGGMVAIGWTAISETEFSMFGITLKTGHVGVAFVGIGIAATVIGIKAVLKNQHDLASLPSDQQPR